MPAQTLEAFYNDTFEPLCLRTRTQQTKKLYKNSINNFRKFLEQDPTLNDLNDVTVSRFLTWFRRLPRSPATVNKERSNLIAIWGYACRQQIKHNWPSVEKEPEPERVPQAWSRDQLRTLMQTCKAQTGSLAGVPACDWWVALHLIAWDSGERIGAIRKLQWSHLQDTWLVVPAEIRKGKRRDRLYQLADDTLAALRSIRQPKREAIFPWPFCEAYLWTKYATLLKEAGLPHGRHSKFHRMRRSVASHAEAAGADATKLLGHSARKVTTAYLDPRIVEDPQPVNYLFRPTKPGTP